MPPLIDIFSGSSFLYGMRPASFLYSMPTVQLCSITRHVSAAFPTDLADRAYGEYKANGAVIECVCLSIDDSIAYVDCFGRRVC